MHALDYGKGYRYAHDEPYAYAAGEDYFPDEMASQTQYYHPTDRGYEQTIAQRIAFWKNLDEQEENAS
jgi:putative ATPase